MTPEEQDNAIQMLRATAASGASDDELQALAHHVAAGFMPMVLSAAHVCRTHLASREPAQDLPADFVPRHLASWRRYLLSAAAAAGPSADLPEDLRGTRTLVASWHFPEHPAWQSRARDWDWLLVVGRRSFRTESIVGAAQLANFRDDGLQLDIARAFRDGRTVFGMFDFCYEDSFCVVSDFLGVPAITAAGLLKLGERFGYSVVVASGAELEGAIVDRFDLAAVGVQAAADRINRAIGDEILDDPARWLLWGAVTQRWTAAARRLAAEAGAAD